MSSANALITATAEHLARFEPFDALSREDMTWLAQQLRIDYFAKDQVVLAPTDGEVQRLLIIKQGVVVGEQDGNEAWIELHEGECFPLGALLSRRAAISLFKARSDVFVYVLQANDFHELLRRSTPFHDFCTRRMANLLERSQRSLQARYAFSAVEQQSLQSTLGSLIRRNPICCSPDTPLREVLETLQKQCVSAIVVTDTEQRPVGVFTVRDLISRVILPAVELTLPIGQLMTRNPVALPSSAHAFEAAMAMAQHGFRHILVADGGRLTGIISEKDLFSLQRVGVTQISTQIRSARDLQTLAQCGLDIRQLAHSMLAQGVASEQLSQILSTLYDLLTKRIIQLECGSPPGCPHPFCWLALGSEGRWEQTLATDQDNGMIFIPEEGLTADDVRDELLPLARRINDALEMCGFPRCQNGTMAMNAQWCLSLEEWKATFSRWLDGEEPNTVARTGIFFDFRPIHGPTQPAEELRAWLLARTSQAGGFLKAMTQQALLQRPPLGLVRDFVVDESMQDHSLDLKLNGASPLVDAARIFALGTGIAATSTVTRLHAAGAKLNLSPSEIEAWLSAFHFIQMLRLRVQHEQDEAGRVMNNRVDPDQLNDLDRRILKESFRQVRKIQSRLAEFYAA